MKREQSQSIQKGWQTTRGFSLVEVVLSSALFVLFITALIGAFLYGEESTMLSGNRSRAVMLSEEGLEATRNIRDAAFSNLAAGTYGVTTTGNQFNLSGSSDTSGLFTRTVAISSVDSNRRLITSTSIWQQNPQRSGSSALVTYLTNWQRSGIGNWALPSAQSSLDLSGSTDGIKVQVLGDYAYVIRNGNGAGNFAIINISNSSSPVISSTFTVAGTPKNIFVSGSYAYIASDDNSAELQIVNISNPASPISVSSHDLVGSADAEGIYVDGNTAYVVRDTSTANELAIISVSNPSLPVLLGSYNAGANVYEVVASGNYAYLATGSDTRELQVINVSVPLLPTLAGSYNLSGSTDAITIALSGSTIYMGQGSTFYALSVSNPLSPSLLGSVGVTGTLNDISLNFGNAGAYVYAATSDGANEFKVINVSSLSSPAILGQLNITGTNPIFGVAYSQTYDRAYVVGQSDAQEFIIVTPN